MEPDWYDDPLVGDNYDRAGQRISYREFVRLFSIIDYKRVEFTQIGPYVVSTVWLGINHNWYDDGAPIIFETMVFAGEDGEPVDLSGLAEWRWRTEEEAVEGHKSVCLLVQATSTIEESDDLHDDEQLLPGGSGEEEDPPSPGAV